MVNRIIIIVGACIFLFGIIFIYNNKISFDNNQLEENKNKQYQGPVPEGYDEEHFRKTGITKPLEIIR